MKEMKNGKKKITEHILDKIPFGRLENNKLPLKKNFLLCAAMLTTEEFLP
jgi:hypothetical protein